MDNTINLAVCNVCGMIQANRIFVLNNAEGFRRQPSEPVLDLLLSEFSINKYKKDILENYNTILFSGKFSTYTLSERYCAITYFTLKDLKQLVYLKEYCRFLGASITRVNRLIKIINRHYSKSGIFDLEDLQPYYNEVDINVDEVEEMVQNLPYTLTRGLASAIFYECSDLTQKETCKLFGISLPALKRNLKKVR
tara:strand:+ start:907 stop:1491 length:585 start_codon:yes stop_codon:yes gene_type:complete